MRFSITSTLVIALAAEGALASTWFGKTAYNKWHQTELERWLDDHDVKYPTASDRKDLENLVKDNWDAKVNQPYNSWDVNQLQNYLASKGQETKKGAEANRDSLVASVKQSWAETADQATDSYNSVQDWIFDSWTDSQVKAFLDYHGIPSPTPRKRDSLLKTARENYSKVADKVGEAAAYPGNWLYESWSDSDLKAWLDERGVPVPQPSKRDRLVATVRRNGRLAALSYSSAVASATNSASIAQQSLTDALLDAWSDSQIKEWCDSKGIKVPQGSKRNELIALARKHRTQLAKSADAAASSVASAYGAATSKAGNDGAKATHDASIFADDYLQVAQDWAGWAMHQVGLGEQDPAKLASSSASSASRVASRSAAKAAGDASASATSGKDQASASAKSAASKAAKSASSKKNEL